MPLDSIPYPQNGLGIAARVDNSQSKDSVARTPIGAKVVVFGTGNPAAAAQ
jgi:hypothetical protein